MWYFSVAKNYNDILALNNLLVKPNGYLRTWHEFKRVAEEVVGRSNRYLKTEYNTVIGASQMAEKWQAIQRDKAIFPYVQFDVVQDGRTSDICKPLHNVIVNVDSPILKRYFPPNHFNCRTTIRRLRYGKPTPEDRIQLPKIPEAFKNNPGQTGEIFTGLNSYIANTPQKVTTLAYKNYRKDLIKKTKEKLKGKSVYRKEINGAISFGAKGIQDAINNPMEQSVYYLKNELIQDMAEILQTAKYFGFSDFKEKGVIKGSHIFGMKVKNKTLYIVVKEYLDGTFKFYSVSDKENILKGIK